MADVTVKQLAQVVYIPVERLLNQLQEAGLSFTDDQQTVNEDQKRILLNHLKGSSSRDANASPERITLRRKSLSQVTVGHDNHNGKTVNIEVRKKKTFVKRSAVVEQPEIEEIVAHQEPISAQEDQVVTETLELNELEGVVTEESKETAKQIPKEDEPVDPLAIFTAAILEHVDVPEAVVIPPVNEEHKSEKPA